MAENADYLEQLAFVQRLAARYPFVAAALTEHAEEFDEDGLDAPVFIVLADAASWVERNHVESESLAREFLASIDDEYTAGSAPVKGLVGVGLVESLPGIWTESGRRIARLAGENVQRLMRAVADHGAVFGPDLI